MRMKSNSRQNLMAAVLVCALAFTTTVAQAAEPATSLGAGSLLSWNDGKAKQSIVEFVAKVTKEGTPYYVPAAERIAVFDNDGTLWAEQPMYFQLLFALDRVKALAPQHPEWKTQKPFAALLKSDVEGALAGGEPAIAQIIMATHARMTTDEFNKIVRDWVATARHPRTRQLYTEMVYQPMLELLAYLRANGFKTFIVSGGGGEFMRPWTEKVCGIPPEQVIGSSIKTKYELREGKPVLVRLPEINFIDDKAGKPVGIHQHIGRRPIAADPGPDVIRLRIAITNIKQSRPGVSLVKKVATGGWAGSGETGMEAMMLDSMTNAVVGMGVDQKQAEFDQRFSKWGSASDAFKFWAENTVRVIDSFHGIKR